MADKPKWTPGPWRWKRKGCRVLASFVPDDAPATRAICHVAVAWVSEASLDANGHLIAAAPEMYEALEMVRDANRDDPHIPPMALAKIEAALLKAQGKDQD